MTMPANEVAELQERMREGAEELQRIESDRAASADELDRMKAKIAEYDEHAARLREMLGNGANALTAHYRGFQKASKAPRKYTRRAASTSDAVTQTSDNPSARRARTNVPTPRAAEDVTPE